MKPVAEIQNIIYYAEENKLLGHSKKKLIINDVSLTVDANKIYGIAGESGCGKTTLAKIIAGIYTPSEGIIKFYANKKKSNKIENNAQILFQNNDELINPFRSVKDILTSSFKKEKEFDKICSLLNIPSELFTRKGFQLSGGERQRVGLARLLAANPKLLILDEPFSAQDYNSSQNFIHLFKKINEELGIAIICISHDLELLKSLAEKIFIMYKGKIVEEGITNKIFTQSRHPYTNFLLNAANYNLTPKDFRNRSLFETSESMCVYYERCLNRTDKCLDSVEVIESNDMISQEELITRCNNPI